MFYSRLMGDINYSPSQFNFDEPLARRISKWISYFNHPLACASGLYFSAAFLRNLAQPAFLKQHALNFFPLPHGHGSFRPTLSP